MAERFLWDIHFIQVIPRSCGRLHGVLVGDDRAVQRRIDRDRLLNESVEEFAATA